MEPACVNFLRGYVPASSSPSCSSQGNVRTVVPVIRASFPSLPPALATLGPQAMQLGTHLCSLQTFVNLSESVQSFGSRGLPFLDLGWIERFELKELQSQFPTRRRRQSSHTNVGCSSRSLFDSLKGYWSRDCRTDFSSFAGGASASNSGEVISRHHHVSQWASKNTMRSYPPRCKSQEYDDGGSDGGAGGEEEDYERTSGGSAGEEGGSSSSGYDAMSDSSNLDQPAAEIGTLESELSIYTGRMKALENFREEVAKPDEEISLVRAAVFVAQHMYPRITADEVEAELDKMAAELEPTLPPPAERYTMRMINAINKYLYGELGYKGAEVYLDPDNSCINMVLKRREGLPLTMSLVYMELAKRVGLPMQGVNLPAHFMCRPTGDGLEFFIDAHAGGKITFLQDAEVRLSVVYGVPVAINPEFLKHTSITNRAFLLRLLFNLKRIYFERKDPVSTLCIIDYIKIVRPGVIEETRDYGICLYLLNRFSEAIPCLESYLQEAPRATDAEAMRTLLLKMRKDL